MWPESLSSIGILRPRPAAQNAHCQYAGCKNVELRVYETAGNRKRGIPRALFAICLEHALRWSKWDADRREAEGTGRDR